MGFEYFLARCEPCGFQKKKASEDAAGEALEEHVVAQHGGKVPTGLGGTPLAVVTSTDVELAHKVPK